jgi:hypothetical protein
VQESRPGRTDQGGGGVCWSAKLFDWIRTHSADSLARHGFLGGEASERNSASSASASASAWGEGKYKQPSLK